MTTNEMQMPEGDFLYKQVSDEEMNVIYHLRDHEHDETTCRICGDTRVIEKAVEQISVVINAARLAAINVDVEKSMNKLYNKKL